MRLASVCALGLALFCAPVAAQTPSIMEHYRAYTAALDRGDLATALTEAELALAASEAANGPRTGVLALNLALIRLQTNDMPGALAPARRAFELAQSGAPGADLAYATLVLGRAELANANQAGADRLTALFASNDLGAAMDTDIFPTASDLAAWAMREERFDVARAAWEVADHYASGAPTGQVLGRATALTGQGAAILLNELEERGGRRWDRENALRAHALLSEAEQLLRPAVHVDTPTGDLSIGQRAYAQVLAWRGVARTKLMSDGVELDRPQEEPGNSDSLKILGPVDLTRPFCLLQFSSRRLS